ncbi:MAG: DUF115 domain-containing protein [Aphanocapsa sp. GSE-SYN-MK-11-07L]|jgi:hypothetical protein|nr:DUF115 domain-containing protein [Aphanocapsa sp. GSE-SYN-MK-11-07L]
MDSDNIYLRTNPTINPYRYASFIVLNRLKWDLRLESWRSRRRLNAYRNKHKGEKAVILCNGPSLLKSDFSLLNKVFTFGLNKINLLFSESDFRPSCIVAVNSYVIEQNSEFYNQTQIPLFIDQYGTKFIESRNNVSFLHSVHQPAFAKNCSVSIHQGGTVTYVALQLAFHMGFSKVALIGCDHSFTSKGSANKVVQSSDQDLDHFDKNYFAGGDKWQLPDLPASEMSYILAREVYKSHDRLIVNSTFGGCLEIFQRMDLESFLRDD